MTVADTDRAIDFYVDKLGFEKVVDIPMGARDALGRGRLARARDDDRDRSAAARAVGRREPDRDLPRHADVDADHAALKAAGVDVDEEVTRYGDPVPPMFWLRDPDGNSLIIVEPAA